MYTGPYINGAPIEVPPAFLNDVINPARKNTNALPANHNRSGPRWLLSYRRLA